MVVQGPSIPDFCLASGTRIAFRGQTVGIADLARQSEEAAAALTALGIGRGDRIALWLPNCPEWFVLFIAAARTGAISVMVNTRYRSGEVADIVGRSGARALFVRPNFRKIDFPAILRDIDSAALGRLETVVSVFSGDEPGHMASGSSTRSLTYAAFLEGAGKAGTDDWPSADELPALGSAIFTTSGTTSKPKFVLHSQQNATRHAQDVVHALDMTADGAPLLQNLPLCGVFGFCNALATIAANRPLLLEEAFSAERMFEAVRDHRITHLFASDDMIHPMLDLDTEKSALQSLKRVGFAAFNGDPEALMDRCEAHGVPLVGLYGMSEVMALFASQPPNLPRERRVKGAGALVCPETEVRVRNPETGALLIPGETGTLEIKTPNQMLGYFENPDATAAAVDADGFLRTGDAGYLDDVGFVYLARMGDALRLGGFLVAPEEIMGRIEELPGVSASQVVGVLVEERSRCAAFVIPADGAEVSEQDVIQHCREGLAAYKAPVAVWAIGEFPTTRGANGTKVQRSKLQQLAQRRLDEKSGDGRGTR